MCGHARSRMPVGFTPDPEELGMGQQVAADAVPAGVFAGGRDVRVTYVHTPDVKVNRFTRILVSCKSFKLKPHLQSGRAHDDNLATGVELRCVVMREHDGFARMHKFSASLRRDWVDIVVTDLVVEENFNTMIKVEFFILGILEDSTHQGILGKFEVPARTHARTHAHTHARARTHVRAHARTIARSHASIHTHRFFAQPFH